MSTGEYDKLRYQQMKNEVGNMERICFVIGLVAGITIGFNIFDCIINQKINQINKATNNSK